MKHSRFRLPASLAVAAATAVACGGGGADPVAQAPALSAKQSCDQLVGKTLEGGEVLKAELIAASDAAPEHCMVTGRIAGSPINFVAKLPSTWNGKARMGASGGWQGSLSALNAPAGNPTPLSKGYVDYITDSGHTGQTPPGAAFDSSFATTPEGLANFAGLAHQRTTLAVKAIARERYGQPVQRTYFEGCSGGGHIALLMAWPYLREGAMSECEKAGCHVFCNGTDVKRVQLRSQAAGVHGTNEFNGPIVMMCAACRKTNRGGVKMAPADGVSASSGQTEWRADADGGDR